MADTAPESAAPATEQPSAHPTEVESAPVSAYTTDAPPPDDRGVYAEEPDYSHLDPKADDQESEPAESAPAAEPLSEAHYQWGQYLGLSQQHVDAMPREALENLIHSTHARIQQQAQWQAQQQAQWRQQQQQQQPRQPQQQWAFQPIQPLEQMQPIVIPPAERENYDPMLLQAIEQQNAAIYQQNAQNRHFMQLQHYMNSMALQHQQIQSVQQREVQDRATEMQFREFDKIVSEIDGSAFGNGRRDELQDQTHRSNRDMLAMTVRRIAAGHQALGEEVPPIKALTHAAYAQVFGDKIRGNTLSEVARKSKERLSQVTAKPTRRQQRPLSSDERAIQTAKKWYAEHGVEQEPSVV